MFYIIFYGFCKAQLLRVYTCIYYFNNAKPCPSLLFNKMFTVKCIVVVVLYRYCGVHGDDKVTEDPGMLLVTLK